ncbi:transketolase [Mycoplasmopsis caviae]|uniref:transketolase n=1 Tax=Mycoplasmopsis caviae TaxID=55603 RepID=A0A3P8MEI8_9BACT|nr:transketolase [Mycoplasmopsis caviae]UUD35419.1 transketolase [Mycoplasmopsis caviae]VDR41806.1 Transketolase [Mycoplasmopsis caviae]
MKNNNLIENKLIASMRGIALDSINKAKGGHIGMAIGAANITYSLLGKELKFSKTDPKWINRDRFVLSAGHGSMAYYSIMHFLGLLSKEDMQNHKTLHSKTPSHPELEYTSFVDASTGPLGQGVAMAVGMALSLKSLQNRFNRKKYDLIDHYIYALHGDGCIQEGVALEAIQFAGTNKLDRLILIHDYNNAQIDTRAQDVNNIDFVKYLEACNFATFIVKEDKPELILEAIKKAKASKKPSYIQVHTKIAKNTKFEDSPKGHHGLLKEEDTIEFKKKCGLASYAPFEYDSDVYDYGKELLTKKEEAYKEWVKLYEKYKKEFPNEADELEGLYNNKEKYDFSDITFSETNVATRNYFAPIMQKIDQQYKNIVGGSADLTSATKVGFSKNIVDGGKNIHYGIREFAMVAINNGIYLHSHLRTIDSTFLSFADYEKGALRLGSIMKIPSVHVFTHDSYQVGGDGPTHQPVEQLSMLRSIPNLKVIRPMDESEVKVAFNYALNQSEYQVAIIGCRQNVKSYNLHKENQLMPAYVIKAAKNHDISILASGSEVDLAEKVANKLVGAGVKAQVISVPLLQDLINDEKLIKSLNLDKKPMFVIEASNDTLWYKLSKYNKIDAMLADGYGYSADGFEVYKIKGFSLENAQKRILEFLK